MNSLRYNFLFFFISIIFISIFFNIISISAISDKYQRGVVDERERNGTYLFNIYTTDEHDKYEFVDIDSVSFLFNDLFFNATIWLKSLDDLKASNFSGIVKYGILFNSDLNSYTGFDGIDYEYELTINSTDQERIITKELNEIAKEGYKKIISSEKINWNKFLNHNQNYIDLNVDLEKILNSEKYRILFYTIFEKKGINGNKPILLLDTTKIIHIPPPEVQMIFHENPIKIQIGKSKDIELTIISESLSHVLAQVRFIDFEDLFPNVQVYFHDVNQDLGTNKSTFLELSPLTQEIKQIRFNVDDNAVPTNKTVKFTTEIVSNNFINYFDPLINKYKSDGGIIHDFSEKSTVEQHIRIILYHEDLLDQIHETWQKLGGFLTFIYVPIAALIPFIIKSLRKYVSNKKPDN